MSTLVELPKFAHYIEIENPFDVTARIDKDIIVDGVTTLADLKPEKFNTYLACISGELIDESEWSSRVIKEGEHVVFSPVPEGGDGGAKSVLRIVAIIALSVYAPQLAVAIPGIAAGSTAAGFATAAIIAGGSLAINKLIPIKPQLPQTVDSLESSQNYGVDGAKNTAREGVVVPLIYGSYRVAGNLIDFFTENTDDGNQDMFVRFALSEGQIDLVALDSVEVNDQPLSSYEGVELFWSDGAEEPNIYARNRDDSGSTLREWNKHPFGSSATPVSVGVDLTETMTQRTTGTIDAFRVDLACPQGWRRLTDEGGSLALVQDLEIVYTKLPDGEPKTLKSFTPQGEGVRQTFFVYTHNANGYTKFSQPLYYETLQYGTLNEKTGIIYINRKRRVRKDEYVTTKITVGYRETAEVPDFTTRVAGKHASTFRLSFRSPPLEQGQYQIEVRRTDPESTNDRIIDKIVWTDLTEIISEQIKLKHTAWFGLKIRLSNQLNQLPKVTAVINGRVVNVYERDETTGQVTLSPVQSASTNPAWIALDMLTNKRYGAAFDVSRIDLNAYLEWGEYCEEKNLQFNGVFDQGMSFWDAIEYVFRVGRAKPINLGTRFSVVSEKAEYPSMLFNVANMVKGSFSIQWLPLSERANEIDVKYHDAEDNYVENIIRVTDPSVPGNETKRRMEMKLYGVTDFNQATQEAYLQLNMNRYIQQSCKFDVPIEAISCIPGDTIIVQHDVPAWGVGGRTRSVQPEIGIGLDRPLSTTDENDSEVALLSYSGANDYELLLHYDNRLIQTDTVDSIVANRYVRLASNDYPSGKIDRAVVNGVEYEVVDTFVDSIGEGVVLKTALPNADVGSIIELYETDALITHSVMEITTEFDEGGAALYSNIITDPYITNVDPLVKWVFGRVNRTQKPFRVTDISGDGDMIRTVSCIEYNENVYVDGPALPPPNYSQLSKNVAQVSDIEIVQDGRVVSGFYSPVVFISWNRPSDSRYQGALVQMRFQDEDLWRTLAEVTSGGTTYEHNGLSLGDLVEYRVVSKGSIGNAPVNDAPRVAIEIINPPPLPVLSFVIEGKQLSWSHPKESRSLDHDGWEIRYHSGQRKTWNDAQKMHEGVLKNSPFDVTGLVSGETTFLIKAVDTNGQYDELEPIMFVQTIIEGDVARNAVLQHTTNEEGTLNSVASLAIPPESWNVNPPEAGQPDELSWATEAGPHGETGAVLKYTNLADTGFSKLLRSQSYSDFFDTTKRYRVSIAFKANNRVSNWQLRLSSNLEYLDAGNDVNATNGGTFLSGNTSAYLTPELEDKWCLVVGEIFPEGHPITTTKYGGVYDMETGNKIANPNFSFRFGDTSGTDLADLNWLEFGMYHDSVGRSITMDELNIHVVDGTEPTIAEMCIRRSDPLLNVLDTSSMRAMRYFNEVSLSEDAFVFERTKVRGATVGSFYPSDGSSPMYNPDSTANMYDIQYNAFEVIVELDRSTASDYDPGDLENPLQFFFELNQSDIPSTLSLSKGSWDLVNGERVWIPSNGRAVVEDGEVYYFRISIPSYFGNAEPPTITNMGYFIDLPDIVESFNDLEMINGELQVPINRTYRNIVFVTPTMQSNQSPFTHVKLVERNAAGGPILRAFDSNGNQISSAVNGDWPLIDVRIRGY